MNTLMLIATIVLFLVLAAGLFLYLRLRRASASAPNEQQLRQIPLHLVGLPRALDNTADERIKEARDNLVFNWSRKAPFHPKEFYAFSLEVTEKIAAVYYPDAKEPLKKATIASLMDLNRRVARRVHWLLQVPPFSMLGSIDLSLIASVKKNAQDFLESPLVKAVKESPVGTALGALGKKFPQLFRAARVAAKGITPGRIAFEVGKDVTIEGAKRLFLSELVAIIADEAQRVYSGRSVRDEQSKAELVRLYTLAQMLRDQGSVSPDEHTVLLRHVVSLKRLEADIRLFLLGYACGDRETDADLLAEMLRQSRLTRKGARQDTEEDQKRWQPLCMFEDFTQVKSLGDERQFVAAVEELAKASGSNMQMKAEIAERVRRDLGMN